MEETYVERIKKIKSEKRITNDMLSEMTGIPLGTLSKILAGFSDSPKLANITAICEALGTSLDYIVGGIPENNNNYTLSDGEIKFIEEYRKLDPHGKEMVTVVMDKENERIARENYETEDSGIGAKILTPHKGQKRISVAGSYLGKRVIPLYDMPVSAGFGEYLDAGQRSADITIPDVPKTASASFALRINGNSMEPKYHNGDILLVEETDSVETGELGIFILDGDGYFKIWGGDRLISLNPSYGDIMLKDFSSVRCAGRVITKLKRR